MRILEDEITAGMCEQGVTAEAGAVALLARHARSVLAVNEVMNLTRIPAEDFVPLHVLDSLSALPFLNAEPEGAFADLGSGAGYPGIPLAVLTGRPVALVESVRKKAAFLEGVVADLCLKATVHPLRAEEVAAEHAGEFGVVVARALSALPSLVELAAPLLAASGALICMKGRPDDEELRRGDAAAALCGMKLESVTQVRVPRVDAERTIVVYRKTGASRTRLPRRNGMAQRQPLA